MLITLSRSEALAHARYVFGGIALRAWDAAPSERDYVADIARSWDLRLAEIAAAESVSLDELTADEVVVLDRLTAAVSHPDLTADAIVEWVDAFPAAIADLFGSAEDADLVEDARAIATDADGAANRQPALALAA